MTDPLGESVAEAADASRDAMALLVATLDRDREASAAIRRNADADHVALVLAAFITHAIDRDELLGHISAWRQTAADFEKDWT